MNNQNTNVASNANASVEDVARIIQADASTTAYCISIANSAAHGGVSKVDNVLDAVVRLGIEPTRDLVVAYTVRSLFSGTTTAAKKLMHEAWQHSCRIAALSYILARDVGRLNPERALLAGLLHDIGVTVLIKESQSIPVLIDDPILFDRLCHDLSGQIGAMVLRAWKFPDVFVTAALEAEFFGKPVVAHDGESRRPVDTQQARRPRSDRGLPAGRHRGSRSRTRRADRAARRLTRPAELSYNGCVIRTRSARPCPPAARA